jgi:ketosteroid isomerase-like protein
MTTATDPADIVHSYFKHLTNSDIASIVALFADDAYVASPVLGTMRAGAFFDALDGASARNVLTVHQVMSSDDDRFQAAHFTYDWTLRDGGRIEFDGVDVFEFNDANQICSMKIFYDTHPTRAEVGNKYERQDNSDQLG